MWTSGSAMYLWCSNANWERFVWASLLLTRLLLPLDSAAAAAAAGQTIILLMSPFFSFFFQCFLSVLYVRLRVPIKMIGQSTFAIRPDIFFVCPVVGEEEVFPLCALDLNCCCCLVTTLCKLLFTFFSFFLKIFCLMLTHAILLDRCGYFFLLSSFLHNTAARGELPPFSRSLSIAAQPHCRICRCNLFLSFEASSFNDHHCFFFNCCPPLVGNCQLVLHSYYNSTNAAQSIEEKMCVCSVLFKVCSEKVKVALQSLALSSMEATFFFSWGHGCPMPHLTWSFSYFFSMNEHLELRSFFCDSLQVTGSALWSSLSSFLCCCFWLLTDRLSWLLELSTKSFSSLTFCWW